MAALALALSTSIAVSSPSSRAQCSFRSDHRAQSSITLSGVTRTFARVLAVDGTARLSIGVRKRSSQGSFRVGNRWFVVGRRRIGATVAAAVPVGTEALPAKLQEIVKLFQAVADPRAKYEQLLYYAKQLKPLAKELCTKENKVEGCVSQVWVQSTLNPDGTVQFEADSDSLLTKGLAALLVEGLSGATVSEILKVTPDFIQMLGLKQSLTPSRSNGFLNMLKLMQKKTLQMYMEVEAAKTASSGSVREYGSAVGGTVALEGSGVPPSQADTAGEERNVYTEERQQSKKLSIEKKLQEALAPTVLLVDDVSHQHAGHAGVHKGATETHFNVKVVSDKFTGTSLIKRHRLIYDLLDEELKNGVHALSLVTKSPSEAT